MKDYKKIITCLIYLLFSSSIFAQNQTNERAQWFTDTLFGMIIHWGVYSGAEGFWKGEKLRDDNNYAEWIMYRNRIDRDEFLTLLDRFNWDEIDPEEWVLLTQMKSSNSSGYGLNKALKNNCIQ